MRKIKYDAEKDGDYRAMKSFDVYLFCHTTSTYHVGFIEQHILNAKTGKTVFRIS
jgi:hypothetical protein